DVDRARTAAVRDKSAADSRHDRDTMRTRLARNVTQYLARGRIEHHGMRAARNKQAMRGRIGSYVVPASLTAEVQRFRDTPIALCRYRQRNGQQQGCQRRG